MPQLSLFDFLQLRPDQKGHLEGIKLEKLCELGFLNCTDREIAHYLELDIEEWLAFQDRHPFVKKLVLKARAAGNVAIRQSQFESAMHGNATMQVWLGRSLLKQNEVQYEERHVTVQLSDISEESRTRLVQLRNKIYGLPVETPIELTSVNCESVESEPEPLIDPLAEWEKRHQNVNGQT